MYTSVDSRPNKHHIQDKPFRSQWTVGMWMSYNEFAAGFVKLCNSFFLHNLLPADH